MSARKQLHIGVFIPSASAAQLLDTASIDVFGMSSYQYLSPMAFVPKDISSLAPEVKISYVGSQKAGEATENQISPLLSTSTLETPPGCLPTQDLPPPTHLGCSLPGGGAPG